MYKISPNNLIAFPPVLIYALLWMLISEVYNVTLWLTITGYIVIGVLTLIWVASLARIKFVDILKPLNRNQNEDNS